MRSAVQLDERNQNDQGTGELDQMRLMLGLLAFVLAGCGMTDDKTILEDITPASAATPKIDAQFKTARIPVEFSSVKAIKGHTTWGATYLNYAAGYAATAQDAQAFLDAAHAQQDPVTYRSTEGCAPNGPGRPALAAPSEYLKLWIDNGVIDRCAKIESWRVPTSELISDRAAATVYRALRTPQTDDTHVPSVAGAAAQVATVQSFSANSSIQHGDPGP